MQVFHPSFNTIAKASLFGGLLLVGGAAWVAAMVQRSPYMTQEGVARSQPVPFSHEHHVRGLGIDCRYCHTSVQDSSFAGIPSTKVCMTCHSQIWVDAPILEPVRQSWATGRPLPWTRVHDLPEFVYFNHSIHVQKGVGCTTCHGDVDRMPLTWQTASLQMDWCLKCHRQPENFLRPRDQVFSTTWRPPADQAAQGRKLAEMYHVRDRKLLTDCSTCHR